MKTCLLLSLLLAVTTNIQPAQSAQPDQSGRPAQPNILLLLTDDLGWQDVGCYDIDEPTPFETPHIDALAKEGVQFWQGYSPAPTCVPTRSAILSGIHPARAQLTHVSGGRPPAPHHFQGWHVIPPWYRAAGATTKRTIATVLRNHGYYTGHAGKWHMGAHNPQETNAQGFDFAKSRRGATLTTPDRSQVFASQDPNAKYKLDENGYPQHDNLDDALEFLDLAQAQDKPFFLYWCTWLVHAPIHTRSRALLEKYCEKMGVPFPDNPGPIQSMEEPGQKNPYYGAMVEMVDYYIGQVINYLKQTDDPRWPGHKLIENTYIIFTSDNGGALGSKERYTDNRPLQKGKISAMEGGTRVPLIIVGPGIPRGVQSEVMVNGLDFYPTILSWSGTPRPDNKTLDGCDLSTLLASDPTDPALVRESDGRVRDTMVWHFPNSVAQESTIRIGDYKLVRNYFQVPELELFRLYDSEDGPPKRVDFEEANNLADAMPDKTAAMNRRLTEILTEMEASYPSLNPQCPRNPATRDQVPTVLGHEQTGNQVTVTYRENGASVVRADLIYKLSDSAWVRGPASLHPEHRVAAELPPGTTHYFINLVDENDYLVSYPQIVSEENPFVNRDLALEKALPTGQ